MCVNADNQRFEVVFLDGLTVAYEAISVSKSYKMIQSSIFFLVCDIIAWNYFLIIRCLQNRSHEVNANPQMQDKGWEMNIKSIAGALPIMLGDPRKLSAVDLKKYRAYADWLQLMQTKHDIMSYRQDLTGFGEPKEGSWDGFQRINSDTYSGGIVGIFKQGSKDNRHTITVQFLDPNAVYQIISAPEGKQIAKMSGKELSKRGFEVMLDKLYDGALYEIVRL